ncbi:MAG: hypothetical protein QOH31_4939 [Verrucomicrobiota bacterium]|jgi:hypothetical protein
MIQQNTKFTQQKLTAAIPTTSACIIDFLNARDRLSAEFEGTSKELEITWKARKVAARRMPSVRVDRLEDSLYWLLSAATVGYLVLEIIGF